MSTQRTHDYGPGNRRWGHDYEITSLVKGVLRITGWGTGIRIGDLMLLENRKNTDGRAQYRVIEIHNFADPDDMWSATLVHERRHAAAETKP